MVQRLLENPHFGLAHARILAAHHPHPSGLQALAARSVLVRDAEVQRMLLRNVQLPPAVLQRILGPKRLLDVYQLSISREVPEKTHRMARDVLRSKFATADAEDRVELLFRTEGRVVPLLIGVTLDARTTAMLCARTYTSLLLVQHLARWTATPPNLVAHLLKQAVVKHQPQIRAMLLHHPNLPAHIRAGGEH